MTISNDDRREMRGCGQLVGFVMAVIGVATLYDPGTACLYGGIFLFANAVLNRFLEWLGERW